MTVIVDTFENGHFKRVFETIIFILPSIQKDCIAVGVESRDGARSRTDFLRWVSWCFLL